MGGMTWDGDAEVQRPSLGWGHDQLGRLHHNSRIRFIPLDNRRQRTYPTILLADNALDHQLALEFYASVSDSLGSKESTA